MDASWIGNLWVFIYTKKPIESIYHPIYNIIETLMYVFPCKPFGYNFKACNFSLYFDLSELKRLTDIYVEIIM